MIPHVTHNDEADITDLETWRKQLNTETDVKVTMVSFLIIACVRALREFPDFNASLDGEELVRKLYYNIGFAADTPQGLVVPVIRDAAAKGLLELAAELGELSAKARAGKLGPADITGGTFSISSLGGIGGTSFTPIVNAPEVAILGATRAATKPVWNGSRVRPAADAAAVALLRPPRDRRRRRGPLRRVPRPHALGPPSRAAVSTLEVPVPDIGDFTDVPVIEIHVGPGDAVAPEDPLVTLESDKATMDVPAPAAGTVAQLRVKLGDRVSEGSVLLVLETAEAAEPSATTAAGNGAAAVAEQPPPQSPPAPEGGFDAQVVVIGSGIGGYTAAFRAADLGLSTILIERDDVLGGVCLNVGCIPSKALLHAARVLAEAQEMSEHGIAFAAPEIDVPALISWKASVVAKLTSGLAGMAKQRGVEVVRGEARFTGPHSLTAGERELSFEHCIIAAGSEPVRLPFLPEDPRVLDSTTALAPESIPARLLVIGGGIIGLEMATVYDALGSKVTVVELLDGLIPGCDRDLVKPLQRRIAARYEAIRTGVEVTSVTAGKAGLEVAFSSGETEAFDAALVAVGRRANGDRLEAERAGVDVEPNGVIAVDPQRRTNVPWIYAIGDLTPGPMLAHKAAHEGRVAAEAIAGEPGAHFEPRAIPSVAYTDPEVAWMGLTETEAKAQGTAYEAAVFPWAASGRALSLARPEGFTKLLVDPDSRRILGAGIVGVGAGDLISETVLAIEMGAVAEDLALTIHPHPTLSETVAFAAEVADGTVTDLPAKRGRSTARG